MDTTQQPRAPGDIDPAYPPLSIPPPQPGGEYQMDSLIELPDHYLIVACSSYSKSHFLARLRSNGDMDINFGTGGYAFVDLSATPVNETATTLGIKALSDGRLLIWLVAWVSEEGLGKSCLAVARFTPAGQIDNTFGDNGIRVCSLPGASLPGWLATLDKPILENTRSAIVPFPDDNLGDLLVQDDGKLLALFGVQLQGLYRPYVLRLTADGDFDPTFNGTGYMEPKTDGRFEPHRLVLQGNGKIVLTGVYPESRVGFIARFDEQGNLDTSFASDGYYIEFGEFTYCRWSQLLLTAGGELVSVARDGARAATSPGNLVICKLNTDGHRSPSFNNGTSAILFPTREGNHSLTCYEAFIDNKERIVLVGSQISLPGEGPLEGHLARILSNGEKDTNLGEGKGIRAYENFWSIDRAIETNNTHYLAIIKETTGSSKIYHLTSDKV